MLDMEYKICKMSGTMIRSNPTLDDSLFYLSHKLDSNLSRKSYSNLSRKSYSKLPRKLTHNLSHKLELVLYHKLYHKFKISRILKCLYKINNIIDLIILFLLGFININRLLVLLIKYIINYGAGFVSQI